MDVRKAGQPLVCPTYTFLLADTDEVDALCAEENPAARWPSLCLNEIGVRELALLGNAVACRDSFQSDRAELLIRGSEGGPVILRLPPLLVSSLARLKAEAAEEVAAKWERHLRDWDTTVQWPARTALVGAVSLLCGLARQGVDEQKQVFWRLTPEAWDERLQLEQDFNCVELREGPYWRIRYGRESSAGPAPTSECSTCLTRVGWFHLSGCPREECPKCHQSLVTCGCERGYRGEQE